MEISSICDQLKEKVLGDLAAASSPLQRGEIVIQALYRFSNEVLPPLGHPSRAPAYLKGQLAALDLVSFLAIHLIHCGDRRAVAVLVEVGEGCADPLLKKKLSVYAQELLAKTSTGNPQKRLKARLAVRAPLLALFILLLAGLALQLKPTRKRLEAPPPSRHLPAETQLPVVLGAGIAQGGAVTDGGGTGGEGSPSDARRAVPTTALSAPATTTIRVVDNQILVPVIIKNGTESVAVELVLDTGATRTALYEGLAPLLGIDLRSARASRAEVADGRVINSRIARIDLISVGPFSQRAFEVELFAYSGTSGVHDGLLGMDFLSKHRYQIDMERGEIHWL